MPPIYVPYDYREAHFTKSDWDAFVSRYMLPDSEITRTYSKTTFSSQDLSLDVNDKALSMAVDNLCKNCRRISWQQPRCPKGVYKKGCFEELHGRSPISHLSHSLISQPRQSVTYVNSSGSSW